MNGFLSDVALENLPMITYIKFDLEMREQIYLFLLGGTEHKLSSNGIVVFKLYNSRRTVGLYFMAVTLLSYFSRQPVFFLLNIVQVINPCWIFDYAYNFITGNG